MLLKQRIKSVHFLSPFLYGDEDSAGVSEAAAESVQSPEEAVGQVVIVADW